MSFRVAIVSLCDILCVSEGMCVHDRRGRTMSIWREPDKVVSFKVSQEVVMSLLSTRSKFYTPHFTLATLRSALSTLTLHTLNSTLYTPQFALYTPHFTPHKLLTLLTFLTVLKILTLLTPLTLLTLPIFRTLLRLLTLFTFYTPHTPHTRRKNTKILDT